MKGKTNSDIDVSVLNTHLEEYFIAPLTGIKGALQILQKFPDMDSDQRMQFVTNALKDCDRLENGVLTLSNSVYGGLNKAPETESLPDTTTPKGVENDRISIIEDPPCIEVNLKDYVFQNSEAVNQFYDQLEAIVRQTEKKWFMLVNYSAVRVWPEAWVAFAHRGKKINSGFSLGTFRFSENPSESEHDLEIYASREEALDVISNKLRK